MGERRALVIGSQCEALGNLLFLPRAASAALACPRLKRAVSLSIRPLPKRRRRSNPHTGRAAKDKATLFIAFIGHGESPENSLDLFLMPRDAKIPPDPDDALHPSLPTRMRREKWTGLVYWSMLATPERRPLRRCKTGLAN
jgi:hypothetical protein